LQDERSQITAANAQAEAQGLYEVLTKQAEGFDQIVKTPGDVQHNWNGIAGIPKRQSP